MFQKVKNFVALNNCKNASVYSFKWLLRLKNKDENLKYKKHTINLGDVFIKTETD